MGSGLGPIDRAWLDVSAGVAGDMLCGALVDLGVPVEVLADAVDRVVPGSVVFEVEQVRRAGLRATSLVPRVLVDDPPERSHGAIVELLHASRLRDDVTAMALEVFAALAGAEATVHGIDVDAVTFHEVGALDAIADVVGACAGLAELGATEVTAGPLGVGSGTVTSDHGVLPVPAPAVLELATGWRCVPVGPGEATTPTGAALATTLASPVAVMPAMRVVATGIGAGSRDTPDRANVTRVVVGTASGDDPTSSEEVELAANIDDLDPRVWPGLLDHLLELGAADAWLSPIVMKKGRPAHTLSVLVAPDRLASVREAVFAHTTTIGVRETRVAKRALERTFVPIEVLGHPVTVKVAHRDGVIVRAMPEYDEVAAVAGAVGRPVRDVLDAATSVLSDLALVPGQPLPPPAP